MRFQIPTVRRTAFIQPPDNETSQSQMDNKDQSQNSQTKQPDENTRDSHMPCAVAGYQSSGRFSVYPIPWELGKYEMGAAKIAKWAETRTTQDGSLTGGKIKTRPPQQTLRAQMDMSKFQFDFLVDDCCWN